jgi:hypothetical protein
MLKSSIIAAALLALLASPALAKTYPIPAENPIATVTFPDKWTLNDYEGGAEATSPDGAVYIAAESIDASDVKKAVEDGVEFFSKQGVTIDPKSIQSKDTTINGLKGFDLQMGGKDQDGPTTVGMTMLQTNAKDKLLVLYYWGSDAGTAANKADIQAVGASVQATK